MSQQSSLYRRVNPKGYRAVQTVMRLLLRSLTRLHVSGQEHVPPSGRVIVATNHLSFVDSPAIFVATPRYMNVLAAEKYENHPLFRPLLNTAGAIFIDRGEVDRGALKSAMAVLNDDHALGIAVEGTRSRTGGLQEGKTGVAYIATRTNTPILPGVVWGSENVIPALRRFKRADVYVKFGEPIVFPEGRARSSELEQYTEQVMLRLAAMLPPEYHGIYQHHPSLQPVISTSE